MRAKSPLFISRISRISWRCFSQSPNRLMAFSTIGYVLVRVVMARFLAWLTWPSMGAQPRRVVAMNQIESTWMRLFARGKVGATLEFVLTVLLLELTPG